MSQKWLTIIIVLLIFGVVIYIGVDEFKKALILEPSPSPSPTPGLNFLLNPSPQATSSAQPAAGDRLLKSSKRLAKFPGVLSSDVLQNKKVVIETQKGKIELEIYPEATKAASNFLILASNGFYDNLTFHRVEPGFVIQGGDPSGNGTGGPGYKFEDEPVTRAYNKGIVAYANSGPNTNGSQFFIMLDDHSELPPKYTIFGTVILGQEVVEKISVGDVMQSVTVHNLR